MKTKIFFILTFTIHFSKAQIPAFPGAEGFGANATGGRGGSVYYVTNLNCSGIGSLNYGLQQSGVRYILFKVSGIIPCSAEVHQGQTYIAGQTSPAGIIVRGIILDEIYENNTNTDNVIIRHLRSRPKMGTTLPNQGYVLDDGLRLDGANNVIIDHCSFSNAADESVQISHSQNITIQNCMLSETLGDHFSLGGMLINYSTADHPQNNISIHHNVWNRIGGRFPEFSCESPHCRNRTLNFEVSNNLFWDQQIQSWYNPCTAGGDGCKDFHLNLNFINNRSVARNSYTGPLASFDFLNNTNNQLFVSGNTLNLYNSYSDYQLFYCCNDFNANAPNSNNGTAQKRTSRHNFPQISYTPTSQLQEYATKNIGAFPRDIQDSRLMNPIKNNTFLSQGINGTDYFNDAFLLNFTTQPTAPTDTDNDGMPDTWETTNGLNPNVADHNGTQLSKKFTGIEGYTNLECYLNELSDKIIGQQSVIINPNNTTITSTEIESNPNFTVSIAPNPTEYDFVIKVSNLSIPWRFEMIDIYGRTVLSEESINVESHSFSLPKLITSGTYFIKINAGGQVYQNKILVLK